MVTYTFPRRFSAAILTGELRQTIRPPRKRHARPGDTLHLFVDLRTKASKLIGTAPCTSIEPVTLYFAAGSVLLSPMDDEAVRTLITRQDTDEFARLSGFADWADMRWWWASVYPDSRMRWSGVVIRWGELTLPPVSAQA